MSYVPNNHHFVNFQTFWIGNGSLSGYNVHRIHSTEPNIFWLLSLSKSTGEAKNATDSTDTDIKSFLSHFVRYYSTYTVTNTARENELLISYLRSFAAVSTLSLLFIVEKQYQVDVNSHPIHMIVKQSNALHKHVSNKCWWNDIGHTGNGFWCRQPQHQ